MELPLKIVTHSCFFLYVQFYIAMIMDFGVLRCMNLENTGLLFKNILHLEPEKMRKLLHVEALAPECRSFTSPK